MGLFSKDVPTPPNPIATAGAQTGTNIGTSVANAWLNNTNQVTPQGSLEYNQTGTYSWTDPTTGQTYNIPRFTASQILSPDQQQISNLNVAADKNLAGLAAERSGELQSMLGTNYDPNFNADAYLRANPDVAAYAASQGPNFNPQQFAAQHYQQFGINEGRAGGAPSAGDMNLLTGVPGAQYGYADVGGQQRSVGSYGQQQTTFGDAGNIQRDYGPNDFSGDRSRVEESLYQRMDPQLQRDRANLESRLADQGIKYGSPAYSAAMDDFNRQLTDTRLAITAQGGQEQKLQADMAAQRAGFANAAQQQAYNQAMGRGTFANQAQMEQFQKQLQGGTFANQAQQQAYQQEALRGQFYNSAATQNMARGQTIYGAQNQARAQSQAEQLQARNQPINEITALLSGSQVQNPSFVNTPNNQIPTTDVAGLINNRFSQDMDTYKQQSANFNSLMGGIFGAMGGMMRASDRRVKEDIDRIGTIFTTSNVRDADADEPGRPRAYVRDVDADEVKPLPIYEYSYKGDPTSTRHVGPMAQDVEKIDRRAVKTIRGVKHIDMTRMGSILKAA